MEESDKTGTQDNAQRVRIPWFPKYRELRHLLSVWPGHSKARVSRLRQTLMGLTGTPQNPVDWKDPDTWIPEKLSGEDRKLAYAIWTKSGKTVNPRHTAGHWILGEKYGFVAESSNGNLELTERGRQFADQSFGKVEQLLDQKEGLIELLKIVADNGPARAGVLAEPWGEFLQRVSPFKSPSTIRHTLTRRLSNLVDRDLVEREKGADYAITNAGLDYMKKAGIAEGTSSIPAGIKRYADDEDGRRILGVLADSVELANSLHPECWATSIPKTHDMRFYVGFSILMLLRSSDEVEITLLPQLLKEELRDKLRPARGARDYKFGGRRYLLNWRDFVGQWPSIQDAHHEAIKQAVQKTNRGPEHSTEALGFLNSALGRELPQPGYVDHADGNSTSASGRREAENGGFGALTQALQEEGLLFSEELVANYVLALQTKRFAILTGISGTGKTRVAKAVAQHFEPMVHRRVAKTPKDAVTLEVQPAYIDHGKMILPGAIRVHLNIETSIAPTIGPDISVLYPSGHAKLRTYLANGKYPQLIFKGDFKKWFQSTFEAGDPLWLRVHSSETDDPGEVEFGLPETEVVEQPAENYVVVPVRPDWVDNRGLLGYLNPLTDEYSTTPFLNLLLQAREEEERAAAAGETSHPFFVILDEMNLARVEHYFSDFLSALESGEDIPLHESETIESGQSQSGLRIPRRLKVPGNVLFTGTVNVDETTYMFSPKVLDRAFTIELDQVDLEGFTTGENRDDTSGLNLDGEEASLDLLPSRSSEGDDWQPSRDDWLKFSKDADGHHNALLKLHGLLEARHRHFGYRVANEIARFVNLAREQAADADAAGNAAFDLALLQKVLPKFHGTQQELESMLKEIFHFAVLGGDFKPGSQSVDSDDWEVIAGRLVAKAQPGTPSTDGVSQTAETASSEASEKGSDDPETPSATPQSPAYPRTGAKVLRMLQRLRDRGFTSFIE
ncbi:MAG: hypothetical protein OXJ55_14735 [Caldilineaceae bacterium]|nr:hypothetical protein [Caldilineaceae bacterium]